jgi:hypothetical protein
MPVAGQTHLTTYFSQKGERQVNEGEVTMNIPIVNVNQADVSPVSAEVNGSDIEDDLDKEHCSSGEAEAVDDETQIPFFSSFQKRHGAKVKETKVQSPELTSFRIPGPQFVEFSYC